MPTDMSSPDNVYEKDWTSVWNEQLENYYHNSAPRAGLWLEQYFSLSDMSVLEIAAGSCRDSLYLADRGYRITASDFLPSLVETVRARFPQSPITLKVEDAKNFTMQDRSFDLTFHNGLWVNFLSDEDLCELLSEQARITKKYLVILVHNDGNPRLKAMFKSRAEREEVYNIRFFSPADLRTVIGRSGLDYESVQFLKFGGIWDGFLRPRILGLNNPVSRISRNIVPRLYPFQPWFLAERVACVIRLAD